MKLIFLAILFSSISEISSMGKVKPKICIECKHFIPSKNDDIYGKCSLFPLYNNNFLINGVKDESDYYYCSTARMSTKMCGNEGKLYKRKYKKNREVEGSGNFFE